MGFPNPRKMVEKEVKKALSKIVDPAIKAGKSTVYKSSIWARDAVRKVENEAKDHVRKVEDEAEEHLRDVCGDLEKGLTEKLPEMVKDAAHDLAEAASERSIANALNGAADVIEMMAPDSFTLIFGIELALVVQAEVTIAVELPNPAAKLTEIRKWAKDAPEGRAAIIECIKDFGPESLSVEAKVSGNGLAASWSGESKYSRLDAFLERHGVS